VIFCCATRWSSTALAPARKQHAGLDRECDAVTRSHALASERSQFWPALGESTLDRLDLQRVVLVSRHAAQPLPI